MQKVGFPEYSFPSRAVVNMIASKSNAHTHKELLSIILNTYMETLQTNLKFYCNISSVRR